MSYLALLQALGDYAEPFDPEFNADSAELPESAYRAWVAAVKAAGGTVTAYPWHGSAPFLKWTDIFGASDTYGLPAARYPFARIYSAAGALRSPFTVEPDNSTATPAGDFGYYLAPVSILAWAAGGGLNTIGAAGVLDMTPADVKPDWYHTLTTTGKYVAIAGAGLAVAALLSFVPRRR